VHDEGAAVAVWHLPDAAPVDARASELLADRCEIIRSVEEIIGAHRPAAPHWYLGTMGTLSPRRRQGCGTAVLRPVLDELDDVGMSAYLETSARENVEFYARLGFEVVTELEQLPHGAPDTWCMQRAPKRRRLPRRLGVSGRRTG
jgi:GNAT superfamily N-acetyltransferase